ncbi:heavy metal-binding domain-containing protein [Profundibacter sp.]
MKKGLFLLLTLALSACSPFVEVTDLNDLNPETLNRALRVKTFVIGQPTPAHYTAIAPVTAFSCKHLMTDPPASKGNALLQLQVKALELGASAVVNVSFDTRDTDTFGTNCWETVQASGVAVR